MIGLSIAWVEQIGPWLLMLPVAALVLAVVGLWCRADYDDTWPTHDPREDHIGDRVRPDAAGWADRHG